MNKYFWMLLQCYGCYCGGGRMARWFVNNYHMSVCQLTIKKSQLHDHLFMWTCYVWCKEGCIEPDWWVWHYCSMYMFSHMCDSMPPWLCCSLVPSTSLIYTMAKAGKYFLRNLQMFLSEIKWLHIRVKSEGSDEFVIIKTITCFVKRRRKIRNRPTIIIDESLLSRSR